MLALAAGAAVAGKANNTLNVAFPREVVTLDGLYSNLRENDILSLAVDDVLYTVDPQTLQPVPLVALSHKSSMTARSTWNCAAASSFTTARS